METPRHRRTPRRPLRVVLATLKGAALGVLLTLVVVGGLHAAAPSALPGSVGSPSDRHVVERAVADHHCSHAGFGGGSVPASALIRTARGQVRQVSFEVGWDVYNGRRPGTLIAVCMGDADSSQLVKVHGWVPSSPSPVPPLP